MRKIIILSLVSLFFINKNTLQAQSESEILMTPAEYQNLMETILQAKKRRMAKRNYHYYQTQQRPNSGTTQQRTQEDFVQTKIQELERVYAQITTQQTSDTNNTNTAELERIKSNLNREMEQLRSQLREEQNENKNLTTKYNERSTRGEDELLRRNKYLEDKIKEINSKAYVQQQESQKQQRELDKLNERFDQLQKNQNKTEVVTTPNNDKELTELRQQIKEIEKQQSTLLILSQGQQANNSSDTTTNSSVDFAYMMEVNKQLAELEVKMEDLEKASKIAAQNRAQKNQIKGLKDQIGALEKKLNALPTSAPAPNIPDYSRQISELQAKLRELQAYHNQTHKAPPVVIHTPAPAPKEDIRSFVTSRRQQNVYFQNGSATLTENEKSKIRDIAGWLSTYDRLDITIKGYASNTGSLETNQRLTRQRTETVKQTLLNMGVRADRVILEPVGVDTTSSDPANARRAEIHLLIRN